jgi:DNA-binding winged helix-turn-helix (wHTH) protein
MRVRFDSFILDTERKVLARGGAPVHLTPRAFRLLALLVAERPRAVGKRELIDTIWTGSIVEESSLKSLVLEIRTAIEERGGSPDVIRTVYGHGYAFESEAVEDGSSMAPEARVRVEVQGRVVLLPEGIHQIGRLPTCAVFIDASSVSRIHARLHVGRDTLLIEDAGSKNGTFVSGNRITAGVPLPALSRVRCGDVEITIEKVGENASETETIDPAP